LLIVKIRLDRINKSFNGEDFFTLIVNQKSEDGWTLLMAACANCQYPLIEILITDFNAEISHVNVTERILK